MATRMEECLYGEISMGVIYVIAYDGGCEGFSGPIQAFNDLESAKAAAALGDSYKVFAVPVWPSKASSWYSIQPIKEQS